MDSDMEKKRCELAVFFCEETDQFKLEECYKIIDDFIQKLRASIEVNLRKIEGRKQESKQKFGFRK